MFVFIAITVKKPELFVFTSFANRTLIFMNHHAAMTRNRRTRILVLGHPGLRKQLASMVRERCRVTVVQEPAWALVMLTVRESARNTLFHPGEVLVTEAKLIVDGAIGLGIIVGDQPTAAEELALIDGAWNASSAFISLWVPLLIEEEARLRREQAAEHAVILQTKVDFQTMDSEVPD